MYVLGRRLSRRQIDVIPWAMGDLNRVFAAKLGSVCTGLKSPTMRPNRSMSFWVRVYFLMIEIIGLLVAVVIGYISALTPIAC